MMFWSVGPFWYMVYGIWYVVYGMKMAFAVYSYMFCMCHAQATYNIVHLFLVPAGIRIESVIKLNAETHGSINRMRDTIQQYCTWTGWKADLEKIISNCTSCKEQQISQAEGPPHINKILLTSLELMSILHTDLFKYKNTDYLVTRDQVSTYS